MSEYPDLLSRLAEIRDEAERALQGLENGAIPKGTSALHKIRYAALDALTDAREGEPVGSEKR